MVVPLSFVYIDMIKAFRADCETLIGTFKHEKNDVDTFTRIWKSLGFHLVYEEKYKRNGLEHDFQHDTLQIAKLIMLQDHFSGGMFLMFSLYCLQDCPEGAIRLELEEYRYILRILRLKEEDSKMKDREVRMIFSFLMKEDAFEFVAFRRGYDMEGQHREAMIYNNQYEFYDDESPRLVLDDPQRWSYSIMNNFPSIIDLQKEYFWKKNRVKDVLPCLNLSLDMLQEDTSTTLLKAVTQEEIITEPPKADDNIGARRRSLRNRKMKIKYRYDLDEIDEPCTASKVKRRGRPKGERKLFFKKAINEPDTGDDSDFLEFYPTRQETNRDLPTI